MLVAGGLGAAETDDIVARAEGNAFFVEELASAAAEPGRWVPTDLADVLLVRLEGDDFFEVMRRKLHWGDLQHRQHPR